MLLSGALGPIKQHQMEKRLCNRLLLKIFLMK